MGKKGKHRTAALPKRESPPEPPESRPVRDLIRSNPRTCVFLLLFLAGLLLYLNSLQNGFVFDDTSLILNNKRIQSLRNIPSILGFTGRYTYRPLRELSYVIDYQLTGLNPAGYHFLNIFYHALSSYLVFLVAFHLSRDFRVGLITAFLFLAHPIQTESVAYMSGRRDILTALFYFLGFYCFLRFRESSSKRYLIFVFLSYVLSLLSKEMGVTLPAILLLYDLLRPGMQTEGPERRSFIKGLSLRLREVLKKNGLLCLGLFLIAFAFTYYKVLVRNPSHQEGFYGGTMASNFLTVFGIWVFYLKQLILPLSLNVAHTFPLSKSLFDPRTAVSIFILLVLFILLFKLIPRKPLYAFCGFWFFITLLPVSHIFPHHELLAEHYLYLPSFGFLLPIGLISAPLLNRERFRIPVYLVLAGLFLFYAFQTIQRNFVWKDGSTLWADASRKSPDHPRAKLNLGNALMQEGKKEEALALFQDLIQTDPQNTLAFNSLGVLYLGKNDPDPAIEAFKKAIQTGPTYSPAYSNLARALAMKGDFEGAIREVKEAIRIRPWIMEYHFNLAKFYENQGRLQEAVQAYQEAIRIQPKSFDAHQDLGVLYSRLERNREAIAVFEKAVAIYPRSGKTHFMLGVNYLKAREKEKAIQHLEKALALATNDKDREGIQSLLGRLRSLSPSR